MPRIETEYPLVESRSAVFDANGIAVIDAVGPATPFERWEIESTQTYSDSASQTRLEIHDNSARTRLVEGTYSGNLDTTNTVFKVPQNTKLYYRWTLGTPGSSAKVSLNGKRFVQGLRGSGV